MGHVEQWETREITIKTYLDFLKPRHIGDNIKMWVDIAATFMRIDSGSGKILCTTMKLYSKEV
jgi:hypothetical protein